MSKEVSEKHRAAAEELLLDICDENATYDEDVAIIAAALAKVERDTFKRAVSAAPDMLEALEALVVAVEREAKIEGVSGIACEKLPFARSAIAKAKGQ